MNGDNGPTKNGNVRDDKPERKVDCRNCGGNYFSRDCLLRKMVIRKENLMLHLLMNMAMVMVMDLFLPV